MVSKYCDVKLFFNHNKLLLSIQVVVLVSAYIRLAVNHKDLLFTASRGVKMCPLYVLLLFVRTLHTIISHMKVHCLGLTSHNCYNNFFPYKSISV